NSGSGLGLYLVKEYATMHGGTASVWSVMQQGTIFEVNLSVKGRNLLPADTMQISQRNTILIVEDHSAFRNYMVQELSLNYTILTAENGKTGLEKAIEHEPDLIITDMMMPVMTGVQFCIEVRKRISISHIPVIMLTAKT